MARSIENILEKEIEERTAERHHFIRCEGWRKDGESATMLAFRAGQKVPSLVFKVTSDSFRSQFLQSEFANLKLLAESDGGIKRRAPAPLFLKKFDGTTALAEEALPGKPLISLSPLCFFKDRLSASLRNEICCALIELVKATGESSIEMGKTEIEEHFIAPAIFFRKNFRLNRDEEDVFDRHIERISTLEAVCLPQAYLHDDFCPSNLLWDGRRVFIIDWDIPLKKGLPFLDLFHFLHSCAVNFTPEKQKPYQARMASFFSIHGKFSGVTKKILEQYGKGIGFEAKKAIPFLFWIFWIREAVFWYRQQAEILAMIKIKEPAPQEVFASWAEDEKRRGDPAHLIEKGIYENFRVIMEMRETLLPELLLK